MGSQAAFLSVTTHNPRPAATSKHSMCEHTFGNLISIDAEAIPTQYHSAILVIPRLVSGKCHSGMSLGCGVLQLRSDITMALPVIHSPAPSAPLLPVSQLPANRPRTVDVETLLQELEDVELKAVEAYFAKKKDEEENIEEANRALAQQTPEERREAKKEAKREEKNWRAEEKKQRAEEKKQRAEAKRAEQKKRWTWRRNKKPDDEEAGITAKLPQCYEEIKNLLWIEKNANPIYAKALEEWSKKEKLFTSRVERKKKKVANLKNEIYQLIGYFSVFQGVVLTAVAQSNLLHCNNQWWPILLSVVASLVTIFGVIQKLMQIKAFQKTIHSEEQPLKVVINRLNTLRREGIHKFKFAKFLNKRPKSQSTYRFWIYFWLVILSLVVFTVGFPLAFWRILCHPGPNPYAS